MFIAFIIIVILPGGFVLLLRQAGCAAHPLLQSLRSRGIRPGAAELLLCSKPSFVSAGRIIAAVEPDDRSHQALKRQRRDLLPEEALRQAGIPLLRGDNEQQLAARVRAHLCAQCPETAA